MPIAKNPGWPLKKRPRTPRRKFWKTSSGRAERAGASDIHFQMRGKSAEVGFRLDGIITPVRELPAEIAERVFGRIKFLARLKTYQESLPQDGRIAQDELKCQNDIARGDLPDRHRRKNRAPAV